MARSRVVVVTGGSAGIGRAAALAFARHGDRVAVLARCEERLEDTCRELRSAGALALGLSVDVADAAQVEEAAARIERELGPIAIWVNNAATTVFAPVADTTAEEFRRVTEVTYLGTVHGTLAALRRMLPRNEGCIVQVGSALAYRSIPLQSAYCASKAAIRGFTDSLRSELIHDQSRVRLTMVQLSAFNTPQFDWARSKLPRRVQPVPPIFQPEVAGDAILHASLAPRREVWVGWPAVKSILSTRVLPGLGDRLAARMAYDGQQTAEARPHEQPDGLMKPVAGGFGAHGRFDDRSRDSSLQWQLSKHREGIAAAALLAIGGAAAAWWMAGNDAKRRGRSQVSRTSTSRTIDGTAAKTGVPALSAPMQERPSSAIR
jgi:NAD(P)-dependent dehydrogenase (short-subunit alcohol dehydrogenase family)